MKMKKAKSNMQESTISVKTPGKIAIGLDLGGTGIKAGVVTVEGKILKEWKIPTEAAQGGKHVIDRMLGLCRHILSDLPNGIKAGDLAGIGIGSPGVFDYETGEIVMGAVNLPGLDGTPMRPLFEKELDLPTRIDNDANVFAIAESRWGAARGVDVVIAYTIGTGVGGGVVINGKVFHGAWGFAGELGHITVESEGPICNCGNNGCLEVFASASAIAAHARRMATLEDESLLARIPIDQITCQTVGEAAAQNDRVALSVLDRAAYYLGIGIAATVITVNPGIVVIGGGGAMLGELLFAPVRQHLRRLIYHQRAMAVPVVGAALGPDAGLIGAAAQMFELK
jgi:glucokinase